jgi:hypothetical protein
MQGEASAFPCTILNQTDSCGSVFNIYCNSNSVNLHALNKQIMELEERIKSFAALGNILLKSINENTGSYSEHLNTIIDNQLIENPWFTPENTRMALNAIANELTEENLIKWTNAYPALKEKKNPFRAGVIMAGNIPLVGFHDFLSVLISGNSLIAKTSSKDSVLIITIGDILCSINPGFRDMIKFTEGPLSDFDVIIATGSNNSSRYFEYYFGKYPNIIRKNRNSIAILSGDETDSELKGLGDDIFSYFGLGCRNISKIYIPAGYDFTTMTRNWDHFAGITGNIKYANNYDFNKAVLIVNKEKFHDTGYLLMKEDSRISSPVSVLHYEYFKTHSEAIDKAEQSKENIQCIVGKENIPFGKAQSPHLWDYSDGIDTIDFLIKNI